MINVTKTWLPNKDKYKVYVDKIYESGWVTNNGPLVRELENRLSKFLNVKNIILVSNGTVALEVAYRLLKLKGEVITTPFSFVATTSSLVSNGLSPIFGDINKDTLTLEPNSIKGKITSKTSAIVPVHVFANACDIDEITQIAKDNKLKVIYDAAHAFDITYKGTNILNYGNVSTLSFHATKLFHTIEGGALIINDDALVEEARLLINFGIDGVDSVKSLGTNAKMNEFEAAMGLCVLDDMTTIKAKRKEIYTRYQKELKGIVKFQKQNKNSSLNYSYFPIILKNEEQTLKVQNALNKENIFPRRYFHPSLDTLDYVKPEQYAIISRDITKCILVLPMYPELSQEEQILITETIKKHL